MEKSASVEDKDAQSHYRKSLTHLMKYLEKRVMHVALVGPTLFGRFV